jgi:YD repeat-containing protein
MRPSGRWAKRFVVGWLVGVTALAGCGGGTGAPAASGGHGSLEASLRSLVIPGAQSLLGARQVIYEQAARHSSPDAYVARLRSRTAYAHLDASQAAQLALKSFPDALARPSGGAPSVPPGERIAAYLGAHSARMQLPNGHHAVLESTAPIARRTAQGRWSPLNLALAYKGGSFAPVRSDLAVRIPRRLSAGVRMPTPGVSLTPVDARGAALAGSEGAIDGSSIFYASAQPTVDAVVKPTASGFEIDAILRSPTSPGELRYRVGMPAGARLVADQRSGGASIVLAGSTILAVPAPSAQDAAGTAVPVSMRASGDTLTLSVRHSGESQYPIAVDPTFIAYDQLLTGNTTPTNWHFCTSRTESCLHEEAPFRSTGWGGSSGLTAEAIGEYQPGERSEFIYKTQGESKITAAEVFTEATNNENPESNIETTFHVRNKNNTDDNSVLLSASKNYASTKTFLPACEGCGGGKAEFENTATYMQSATAKGKHFTNRLSAATVTIEDKGKPSVSFDTTDEYLLGGKWINVLHGGTTWLGPNQGAFAFTMEDKGLGISQFYARDWSAGQPVEEQNLISESKCSGVQCPPLVKQELSYGTGVGLPDGGDFIEVNSSDAAANVGTNSVQIFVDSRKPSSLAVLGLPSNGVIAETSYHLTARAVDGGIISPTSGIKTLAIGVDGYEITGKSGSCGFGPCTAYGEWTLNGEELGAGKHTLTLVATDNANNVETKSYEITVRHANPLAVGPGEVDPITGSMTLEANDVSIGGGFGTLGVSRSFNSRQTTAGNDGPLGPQWSISISGEQGIEEESVGGGLTLVASDGSRTTFASDGKGGFIAPKGDENLTLSAEREGEKVMAYLLKNVTKGTTVKFVHPSGASATNVWVIASSEGALTKENGEKQTYTWEAVEEEGGTKIERPHQALAPVPSGVSCSTELVKGCRALSFTYFTATTATGEAPSEWGQYKGRLSNVSLTAYNPTTKVMATTAVAEYSYDKLGRLRAEWDPRISPALKYTYGYDAENRVVSVNAPGQQPWLLRYGTSTGDPALGRLLAATRPAASTALGNSAAPASESTPTLSTGTPVIGTTLSVSTNGSWSNSPLSYGYQWNRCALAVCKAILGAVNQSYTPQAADAGDTLTATVVALNADGAGTASTAKTSTVALTAPKYSLKFGSLGEGVGQLKNPMGVATDSSGNVWVVDHANNRIDEFSASGTFVKAMGAGVNNGGAEFQTCTTSCRAGLTEPLANGFSAPDGIAINGENIYVADTGKSQIKEVTTGGTVVGIGIGIGPSSEFGKTREPVGVAISPNGDLWVGDRGNNRVDEFTETGSPIGQIEGGASGAFSGTGGIAFSGENAYVVDTGNNRVKQFTLSGTFVSQFGHAGAGGGEFSKPVGIATEPVSGDLFVADSANNRVEAFSPAGVYLATFGSAGETEGKFKGVEGLGFTPSGNLYASDLNNNRVQEFTPMYSTNNPAPAPPSVGTSAVTTVDYRVPVSGGGAPYALGSSEVAGWAQTNLPVEATAVFPPDEPMGWPAQDYKRASISYFDGEGRTVNTAAPSGAIATSEYNETNNVVRSLSGSNRAAALKEGAKSAEVSKLLDTQSTYNAEGFEMTTTLGPRHTVKLANGTEILGRERVRYHYDEGSPGGKTYGLVTKTTSAAESESKEFDVRTTINSYSGEENLGWMLRQPTSVTVDSTGLKLTSTTFYDPTTGKAIEHLAPAATAGSWPAGSYLYSSQLTTGGTPASFKTPAGVAIDSGGHVWVADTGDNKIQEFTSSGEYVTQFGTAGTGEGQLKEPAAIATDSSGHVWVADTFNNRVEEFSSTGAYMTKWGTAGTGESQFKAPAGITIDSAGHVWVVDTGNSRVQEFSSTGTHLAQFGAAGTGNGQFKAPHGIAVDSGGNVWVVDTENARVQKFSAAGGYLAQFGTSGTGNGQFKNPFGITIDSTGNMWVTDVINSRVQKFSSTGTYLSQFGGVIAVAIAADSGGNLWVASNIASAVQQFSAAGAYVRSCWTPVSLKKPSAVAIVGTKMWVANTEANRIEEYTTAGEYVMGVGATGTGNGQFKTPHGIAIDGSGNVWVADTGNNRMQEFSSTGAYLSQFGTAGTGEKQFKEPRGVAIESGNVWVADTGNNRLMELSSTGTFVRQVGSVGTGEGLLKTPGGIATDGKGNVWTADTGNNRVQEFVTATGAFVRQFGNFLLPEGIASGKANTIFVANTFSSNVQEYASNGVFLRKFGTEGAGNGQLKFDEGVALDSAGNAWVADPGNNRMEKFAPVARGYHASQTTYYTAAANEEFSTCGNHAEWANLPCRSLPSLQPTKGNQLPSVTDTYNMWDEPETVTEQFNGIQRIKKSTYDAAGRLLTSEVTSTVGTSLPTVTYKYNSETGQMVEESTTVAEKTQTIKSVYNTLGQLTEYVDADGNKSTYTYEVDGQVEEMNDGKGTQVYAYDPTTKALTKLLDLAAGTFTAAYDVEGRMTSETYPNGMTAKYVYNEVGQATHLEYVKAEHCGESCTWFSEGVTYSIHGEALSRASSLASEAYKYDGAGRLLEAQETPTGKGCVVRLYSYDSDSNRLTLTSREPGAEGKCATTGGTVESHTYDEADRLSDTGVTFDVFGNATAVPAVDAGGHEMTSTYFVSNQAHSTTQNGETITYSLDPESRSREVVSVGTTNSTAINHYPAAGEAVSWVNEGGEAWTRNIPGIDGALTATQKNGGTPVLQVHDLQGNIVATAALSETETKLLSIYNSTEFGVQANGAPPSKYSWLGAGGFSAEFSSGASASKGAAYVPQLGKVLQTQAIVPPGAVPNGTYISPYVTTISSADWQSSSAFAAEAPTREAARQLKAAEEACLNNISACTGSGGGGSEIDPHGCVGVGGLGEAAEMDHRYTTPYLNIKCRHSNPRAQLILCLNSAEEGLIGCTSWTLIGRFANWGHWAQMIFLKGWECKVGEQYALAWGFFEIPMRKPEWSYGKVETCEPDGRENLLRAFEESAPGPKQ